MQYIQLPHLKKPPNIINHLLFDQDSIDNKNFQKHIRSYNIAKLGRSFNNGKGPPSFRIQGQSCHLIGSLLPMPGNVPKFAQLYIYDTKNEIHNRLKHLISESYLDPQIVNKLKAMLDEFNRFDTTIAQDIRLKLIYDRTIDGRFYNLPTVSKFVALIVGDEEISLNRDIILETQSCKLKRIKELHVSYLGLQYLLLFPYGQDGYKRDVQHKDILESQQRKRIFVGGQRYMDQLYFDGMTICNHVGFPDLLLTFMCNLHWPKIQRLLRPKNLHAQDQSDIVSRIFKIKQTMIVSILYYLIYIINFHFVSTNIYTFEFQKRGLAHAHILLFLHPSSKNSRLRHDENLYECVKNHMLHNPCGLAIRMPPCMKNGKCSRFSPKKFQTSTIMDQDGFPL
ncbi:hypothetical protein HKD37_15G043838 [Glycine soja]